MKQLVLDLIPSALPSFSNFVVGRNAESLNLLKRLSSAPAQESDLLARTVYLWGASGSGKSHLISALLCNSCNHFSASLPTEVAPLSGSFALDDVHRLDSFRQQSLFNLLNNLQAEQGILVATGDVAPRDLALRRDLASRLGSGLVFHLQPLTDDEKADGLRAHAATRGFDLRDDVIAYLLKHSRRDMSSLMAILDAVDQYSLETGREITLPLLREMSQPTLV